MIYLKSEQHYIDRYDLRTIEECLSWYWRLREGFEEKRSSKEFKEYSKEKFDKEVHKVASYTVNVIKGERYRNKAKTIQGWIDDDTKTQNKYDKATPPDGIRCKSCFSKTKVTSIDLIHSYEEDSQVLFMFECIKCKKKEVFYEDGSEWHYEDPKCPDCDKNLISRSKHSKEKLITNYSCSNCSYKHKDIYDFKKSRIEREAREAKDKKLLTEYRDEFCLNDSNGPDYLHSLDGFIELGREWREREKKEKDPVYQKAKQLKKIKAAQLKDLLQKAMEYKGFQDLQFGKPEIGKYIIIDFSVNDIEDERREYDSCNILKRLIRNELEDTNWRLMTEGISYRLGILTGRLKAFEKEDDLIALVKTSK